MVPDTVSREYYEDHLDKYCMDDIQVDRARDIRSDNDAAVYICDESDLLLDKHAVFFHPHGDKATWSIRGLAAPFHGEKTYFMSATYDAQQKKLLK